MNSSPKVATLMLSLWGLAVRAQDGGTPMDPIDMRASSYPVTVHLRGAFAQAVTTAAAEFFAKRRRDLTMADPAYANCVAQLESYDLNVAVEGDGIVVAILPNQRCASPGGYIKGGVGVFRLTADGKKVTSREYQR